MIFPGSSELGSLWWDPFHWIQRAHSLVWGLFVAALRCPRYRTVERLCLKTRDPHAIESEYLFGSSRWNTIICSWMSSDASHIDYFFGVLSPKKNSLFNRIPWLQSGSLSLKILNIFSKFVFFKQINSIKISPTRPVFTVFLGLEMVWKHTLETSSIGNIHWKHCRLETSKYSGHGKNQA